MPLSTAQLSTLIDTIDAELALRISGKPQSYTQADNALSRMSVEELETLRDKRYSEWNASKDRDSIDADTGNRSHITTKFLS